MHKGITYHAVDLARFHKIKLQKMWFNAHLSQNEISRIMMSNLERSQALPAPLLGEKTLIISSRSSLLNISNTFKLIFRVGDTYPPFGQFLQCEVHAYYYCW